MFNHHVTTPIYMSHTSHKRDKVLLLPKATCHSLPYHLNRERDAHAHIPCLPCLVHQSVCLIGQKGGRRRRERRREGKAAAGRGRENRERQEGEGEREQAYVMLGGRAKAAQMRHAEKCRQRCPPCLTPTPFTTNKHCVSNKPIIRRFVQFCL